MFHILGGFPFLNSSKLGRVNLDNILGDDVSQEVRRGLVEVTFLNLCNAGSFKQGLEDLVYMIWMFLFIFRKHEDVVKICNAGAVDVFM